MLQIKFHCAISGEQNGAFWYIVLHVMLLTYTRAMIRFSNFGGLSRMKVAFYKKRENEFGPSKTMVNRSVASFPDVCKKLSTSPPKPIYGTEQFLTEMVTAMES